MLIGKLLSILVLKTSKIVTLNIRNNNLTLNPKFANPQMEHSNGFTYRNEYVNRLKRKKHNTVGYMHAKRFIAGRGFNL